MTKVCIVDDHEVVREGLRAVVTSIPGLEVNVVGEASSGEEAVRVQHTERPDLFIVDFRLGDTTGERLCRSLVSHTAPTSVVIVSTSSSEDVIARCMNAGAAAYVAKSAGLPELRRALAAVVRGETGIVSLGAAASDPSGGAGLLTRQQLRVLDLLAQGLTHGQIARRLHISDSTVKFHLNGIKARLDVRTTPELIVTGLRMGLIAADAAAEDDAECSS